MLFFRSEEHARRWQERTGLSGTSILTLEQAARLADAWHARKLAPDWRHTADEAEALFAQLGFDAEFWRLH